MKQQSGDDDSVTQRWLKFDSLDSVGQRSISSSCNRLQIIHRRKLLTCTDACMHIFQRFLSAFFAV